MLLYYNNTYAAAHLTSGARVPRTALHTRIYKILPARNRAGAQRCVPQHTEMRLAAQSCNPCAHTSEVRASIISLVQLNAAYYSRAGTPRLRRDPRFALASLARVAVLTLRLRAFRSLRLRRTGVEKPVRSVFVWL